MTSRYKIYPEYKDSEVEWLEYLPFNWQIMKVKFLLKDGPEGIKIGPFGSALKLEDMVKKGIRVYGQENVIKRDFTLGKRFISQEKYSDMKVYTAEQGDILVTMMGTSGKCQVVPESADLGIIDSHLLKLRTNNKILPELFRLLVDEAKEIKDQIGKQGKGSIMHGLNSTIVKELEFPLPSIKEQVQILNFLKDETAKIDTLITKQEKLIELLKEKRQAVISHAVTKGLNPDAPMKDSGVEWFGEVPEHWNVSQLKHHVNTVNGFGFSSNDFQDEGVPFIRAGNIKNKTIVKPDIHLPQSVVDQYQRVIMSAGELIISMVGSDPKIKASAVGQVGIVPPSLAGSVPNQNVVILREKTSLIKRFLFYVVCGTSYRYHLDVFSHKLANQSIISSSLIINAHFVFPEIEEQIQVVGFLDTQLKKYDALVGNATRSIELMKERKTALISAAVTGRIDVR